VTRDLDDVAREFAKARTDSARLKTRLAAAQAKVSELRPHVAAAIVEAAREGRQVGEISKVTGYTLARVRQICRAAGVEPTE
jgi:DNA-directed RNA polymerase specialized sigma24 family protein